MNKKILALCMSLICFVSLVAPSITTSAEESTIFSDLPEREPIVSINSENYGMIQYTYQSGNRTSKQGIGFCTTFEYDEKGNLIAEDGINGSINYIIENVNETDYCIGFEYGEDTYYYILDEIGSVVEIINEAAEPVCRYSYNFPTQVVYEIDDGVCMECSDDDFIGNINPIRYQSWYYDFDTNCYYTGGGVFYDVEENKFIMNDIAIAVPYGNADISAAMSLYSNCINSDTFSTQRYQVTEAEWNAGKRWYDNLSDTEICARLIIGENVYDSKTDDRTAIAYVLANRINSQYQGTSLHTVMTSSGKFSSINPGKYNAGCAAALAARSPSSAKWQQCIKLACILTYTTELEHISSVYAIPAGISSQLHFYAVSELINSSSFTVSGGKMYQNGNELKNVAIAGVGELTIPVNTTSKDFLSGYKHNNLFYSYK